MVTSISVMDVAVGITGRAVRTVQDVTHLVRPVVRPVARAALRPSPLPARAQPVRWITALAREGALQRAFLLEGLARWLDELVPALLEEIVRRAGLTELLLRYVDLDEVVAAVDLDAAATRLDVDAVVRRANLDEVVQRVDVDAIVKRVDVGSVVSRVDVDAVVNRVDLDAAARRLDLDGVLDRIDLTSVVLERVDLEVLVEAVLERVDLTSVVLERVDLDVLVQAVLDRIDLIGLAEEVVDGVDLPEIIRESTGSMASDTVRGVRMQGIGADEAVGRAVDRLLLRRGRRSTEAPGDVTSSVAERPAQTIPRQSDPRR